MKPDQWKILVEEKISNMVTCPKCNKLSIIQVATSDGVPFYSCITEGCNNEAMLLVDIGDGEFVRYDKVYETFRKIVRHGKSEETCGEEGQG